MQGGGRMFHQKIDLHKFKTAAVLNRMSGSVNAAAEAVLIDILAAADVTPAELHVVDGGGVDAALDRVAAAGIEVLIVLGGDGTIRTAAEKCSASGMRFIALPGGTMNMLPRALYGERTWQQALADTVAAPHVAAIGCGEVEGNRFFCGAIFGTPAHWVEAREALRRRSLVEALDRGARAWRRMFSRRVRYDFGAGIGAATAIAVLCPLISRIMPSDAPALEAAALDPKDLGDAFSLALAGLFSDWRCDGNVTTVATRDLKIAAHRPIPALLDGEMTWLPAAAEIRFVPDAFQALVPESSPVLAARHEEEV
jgi:diacylglycerol kinase family enzyme